MANLFRRCPFRKIFILEKYDWSKSCLYKKMKIWTQTRRSEAITGLSRDQNGGYLSPFCHLEPLWGKIIEAKVVYMGKKWKFGPGTGRPRTSVSQNIHFREIWLKQKLLIWKNWKFESRPGRLRTSLARPGTKTGGTWAKHHLPKSK